MTRVQEEIKQDVVDQLAWDDRVNVAEISVEVRNSTVTLRGMVPNHWSRTAAVEDARHVHGVGRVEDQLTVRWPPACAPNDQELWENVDVALRCNPNIDADRVSLSVTNAVASLEGATDSLWKKLHAERVVADVPGISRVENRLTIVPTHRLTDEIIADEITDSMKRNALVDSEKVDVQVANGEVTLSGTVQSGAAYRAVTDAALYTAGVVDVHDMNHLVFK